MKEIYDQFKIYFDNDDKESAVQFILWKLLAQEIDVIELYCDILTPALNQMDCKSVDEKTAVYREHVKSAIVRTILECSYPYVLKKRDEINLPRKGTVIVLCPPEEYHDIGARMAADFFTIAGYETIFVGCNTPYQDVYHALYMIKPELVAISVSNYYNLITANKMIQELKQITYLRTKIVVGGLAFADDNEKYKMIGADYYAKSFDDILKISKKEVVT